MLVFFAIFFVFVWISCIDPAILSDKTLSSYSISLVSSSRPCDAAIVIVSRRSAIHCPVNALVDATPISTPALV